MASVFSSFDTNRNDEIVYLCDNNAGVQTPFLRRVTADKFGFVSATDTTLDGTTVYAPTGVVEQCNVEITAQDREVLCLCDDNAGVQTPFLRAIKVAGDGTVTIEDTTFDGTTAYVVTGTVGKCEESKIWTEPLCDKSVGEFNFIGTTDFGLGTDHTIATAYRFNKSTGAIVETFAMGELGQHPDSAVALIGGVSTLYCVFNNDLYSIDPFNLAAGATLVGPTGAVFPIGSIGGMTWTPVDNFIWVNAAGALYRINPLTGAATLITVGPVVSNTLFSDKQGNLYGANTTLDGVIRQINKVTGAETVVDTIAPGTAINAGDVDWATGDIWLNNLADLLGYVIGSGVAPSILNPPPAGFSGLSILADPGFTLTLGNDDTVGFQRCYESANGVITIKDIDYEGNAYTVLGTVVKCPAQSEEIIPLCDQVGLVQTAFLRKLINDGNGGLFVTDLALDGVTPYAVAGTVVKCSEAAVPDQTDEIQCLCDDNAGVFTTFFRRVTNDGAGAISVVDTTLDAVTPYVPTGTVGKCPVSVTASDRELVCLCDNNAGTQTPFFRQIDVSGSGLVTVSDTTIDGTTPYVTTGTVEKCSDAVLAESDEILCLCDVNAGVETPFLRRITNDGAGSISVSDTTLGGIIAYVPTGQVNKCGNVPPAAGVLTVQTSLQVGAGTIGVGAFSAGFTNLGPGTAIVNTAVVPPGTSVNFEGFFDPVANVFNRLPNIPFDATGTSLLLVTAG